MSTIRMVIIEDRELSRLGLQTIVEHMPNCSLEGCYSDVSSLNQHLQRGSAHILLLDDTLPGIDTANLVRRLKHAHPGLKIIVMGTNTTPANIHAQFDAQADGFIYKGEHLGEVLTQAVSFVMKGGVFLSPQVSKDVLSYTQTSKPIELPERLRDVLALLAKDFSVKEIARTLGISDKAVYSARDRLKELLGAEHTAGILNKAIALKLIEPDDSAEEIP